MSHHLAGTLRGIRRRKVPVLFPFSFSVCLSVERGWMWHLTNDRSIKRNKPIKTVQKCPYLQVFSMLFHTDSYSQMLFKGNQYGLNAFFLCLHRSSCVWNGVQPWYSYYFCSVHTVWDVQYADLLAMNQMTQIVQYTNSTHCIVYCTSSIAF